MSGICWEKLSVLMALSGGANRLSRSPAVERKADKRCEILIEL